MKDPSNNPVQLKVSWKMIRSDFSSPTISMVARWFKDTPAALSSNRKSLFITGLGQFTKLLNYGYPLKQNWF